MQRVKFRPRKRAVPRGIHPEWYVHSLIRHSGWVVGYVSEKGRVYRVPIPFLLQPTLFQNMHPYVIDIAQPLPTRYPMVSETWHSVFRDYGLLYTWIKRGLKTRLCMYGWNPETNTCVPPPTQPKLPPTRALLKVETAPPLIQVTTDIGSRLLREAESRPPDVPDSRLQEAQAQLQTYQSQLEESQRDVAEIVRMLEEANAKAQADPTFTQKQALDKNTRQIMNLLQDGLASRQAAVDLAKDAVALLSKTPADESALRDLQFEQKENARRFETLAAMSRERLQEREKLLTSVATPGPPTARLQEAQKNLEKDEQRLARAKEIANQLDMQVTEEETRLLIDPNFTEKSALASNGAELKQVSIQHVQSSQRAVAVSREIVALSSKAELSSPELAQLYTLNVDRLNILKDLEKESEKWLTLFQQRKQIVERGTTVPAPSPAKIDRFPDKWPDPSLPSKVSDRDIFNSRGGRDTLAVLEAVPGRSIGAWNSHGILGILDVDPKVQQAAVGVASPPNLGEKVFVIQFDKLNVVEKDFVVDLIEKPNDMPGSIGISMEELQKRMADLPPRDETKAYLDRVGGPDTFRFEYAPNLLFPPTGLPGDVRGMRIRAFEQTVRRSLSELNPATDIVSVISKTTNPPEIVKSLFELRSGYDTIKMLLAPQNGGWVVTGVWDSHGILGLTPDPVPLKVPIANLHVRLYLPALNTRRGEDQYISSLRDDLRTQDVAFGAVKILSSDLEHRVNQLVGDQSGALVFLDKYEQKLKAPDSNLLLPLEEIPGNVRSDALTVLDNFQSLATPEEKKAGAAKKFRSWIANDRDRARFVARWRHPRLSLSVGGTANLRLSFSKPNIVKLRVGGLETYGKVGPNGTLDLAGPKNRIYRITSPAGLFQFVNRNKVAFY